MVARWALETGSTAVTGVACLRYTSSSHVTWNCFLIWPNLWHVVSLLKWREAADIDVSIIKCPENWVEIYWLGWQNTLINHNIVYLFLKTFPWDGTLLHNAQPQRSNFIDTQINRSFVYHLSLVCPLLVKLWHSEGRPSLDPRDWWCVNLVVFPTLLWKAKDKHEVKELWKFKSSRQNGIFTLANKSVSKLKQNIRMVH